MKLKFPLISLFVFTAIIAMASSLYVKRQKASANHRETLELELAKLDGTWQPTYLIYGHEPTLSFTFRDPEIELLRPGVIRFTSPTGDVGYGMYKWSGTNLVFHRTGYGYQCPKDFDDMWPDVSRDAPPNSMHLYSAKTRVHQFELKRVKVGHVVQQPDDGSVELKSDSMGFFISINNREVYWTDLKEDLRDRKIDESPSR